MRDWVEDGPKVKAHKSKLVGGGGGMLSGATVTVRLVPTAGIVGWTRMIGRWLEGPTFYASRQEWSCGMVVVGYWSTGWWFERGRSKVRRPRWDVVRRGERVTRRQADAGTAYRCRRIGG